MNKYSINDVNQKAFSVWFESLSFAVKKELAEQVTADRPAADLSDNLRDFLTMSGQDAQWLNAIVDNLWEFSNDLPAAEGLQDLTRAGYEVIGSDDECLTVLDPVKCTAGRETWTEYRPVKLYSNQQVSKFIVDRS